MRINGRSALLVAACAGIVGVGLGLQVAGLTASLDAAVGAWIAVGGACGLAIIGVIQRQSSPADANGMADRGEHAWMEFRRELRRARRHERPLTLVRIAERSTHEETGDGIPGQGEAIDRVAAIATHLRLIDLAWVEDDDIFILLPETPRGAAEALIARIRSASPGLLLAEPRVASFPDDGLTSGALIAAVRGTSPGSVPVPIHGTPAHGRSDGERLDVAGRVARR